MNIDALIYKPDRWHADRRLGIGGSDAGKIMAGEWLPLFLEKTGRAEPDDLSDNLAVVMGSFTEALNLWWFGKQTGIEVLPVKGSVTHQDNTFMRANLDGKTSCPAVFEAKHVSAYSKEDEIVTRYYPQAQHLLAVTGFDLCYLSIFFGSNKWAYFNVARDDAYIAELIDRERDFWGHVERDEQPRSVEAAAPLAIQFDAMREVDLSNSNSWCSYAADWLKHRDAAKTFETAKKELSGLIEVDVKKAAGAGIVASRSKAGAITIRAAKE